jgi:hypothetical protein
VTTAMYTSVLVHVTPYTLVETWRLSRVEHDFFTMTELEGSCEKSLPTNQTKRRHSTEHNNVLQTHFQAGSLNCEKPLLASTLLVVCPNWTTRFPKERFQWRWYLIIFRKYIEKIPVSLNSDRSTGPFALRAMYIYITSYVHLHYELCIFTLRAMYICITSYVHLHYELCTFTLRAMYICITSYVHLHYELCIFALRAMYICITSYVHLQ